MSSAGTEHVAPGPSAGAPVESHGPPSAPAAASGLASTPGRPASASGPADKPGRLAAAAARFAPPAIPAVVMAALGWWGLARNSALGNDEAATSIAARLSVGHLVHLLGQIDAVHGLYYLLMHGWVAIGTSPAVLRIPSVLAMSAAAAMTALLGARLSRSGWTGLFAGLIMALTPAMSFYAQTARSYALVFATVVGSTLALVAAVRAETVQAETAQAETGPATAARRRWLLYAALIALGGYLNEMSLLVLAAHAVTLALGRYRLTVLRHWALAGGAGAALVGPLAVISVMQHSDVSWIDPPNLTALRVLFHDYFANTPAAGALLVACAIIALLPGRSAAAAAAAAGADTEAGADTQAGAPGQAGPGSGAQQARWWQKPRRSLPSVAMPLLVMPALLLIVESLVGPPLYVDRYVLFGEAGAALLAGAGLCRIGQSLRTATGRRWLVSVPGSAVCLAVLLLQLGPQHYIRHPWSRLYDFTAPAHYVGANARPGDGVLFFDTFFRKARLIYPHDFRNTDDFGQAESPVRAGTFRGTDKPFAVVRPLILQHRRIWVVGIAPSPHLKTALLRQQSLVLTRYFTLVRERHFRGIDVTFWHIDVTLWVQRESR